MSPRAPEQGPPSQAGVDAIAEACALLEMRGPSSASELIARNYPFVPVSPPKRAYTEEQLMEVFVQDGFIDRYSGLRLVFPGVLRLLSEVLPGETFPFHLHWKVSATHPAFWELFPTLDHVIPVSRGGPPDPSPTNWVTTSQLRNSAKANWTLEELGWSLFPPGNFAVWDGLVGWFLAYTLAHPDALKSSYLRRWHRAARTRRR